MLLHPPTQLHDAFYVKPLTSEYKPSNITPEHAPRLLGRTLAAGWRNKCQTLPRSGSKLLVLVSSARKGSIKLSLFELPGEDQQKKRRKFSFGAETARMILNL